MMQKVLKEEIDDSVRWLFPIRGIRLLESNSEAVFKLSAEAELWTQSYTVNYLNNFQGKILELASKLTATKFESCIAIKHRSPIYRNNEKITNIDHHKVARDKANRALTPLHFCVMLNTSPQHRCVFVDYARSYSNWSLVAEPFEGGIQQFYYSAELAPGLERTIKQLQKQFTDKDQCEFYKAIGLNSIIESRLPKSFRKVVLNAAHHLSRSSREWEESYRLLNAVTSIEMLMSVDEESNYAKLQNRIEALIGADSAKDMDVSQIFKSRHQLVHNGVESVTSEPALRLAATCLINFTNLGVYLLSAKIPKDQGLRNFCLQYLDMLYQAQELEFAIGDPLNRFPKFRSVKLSDLTVQ